MVTVDWHPPNHRFLNQRKTLWGWVRGNRCKVFWVTFYCNFSHLRGSTLLSKMSRWCICLWMAAEACVVPQVWHILWRITTTTTKRSSDVIRVSVFCLCWRGCCVRFVTMTISRLKSTAAQPNFKVLSLSNTTNDLVLFASYLYQFIFLSQQLSDFLLTDWLMSYGLWYCKPWKWGYDGTLCFSHSVKVLRNFARNGLNNVNLKIAQTTNNIFKKWALRRLACSLWFHSSLCILTSFLWPGKVQVMKKKKICKLDCIGLKSTKVLIVEICFKVVDFFVLFSVICTYKAQHFVIYCWVCSYIIMIRAESVLSEGH